MNWDELKTASIHGLIDWAESQPWCRAMSSCIQDAKWHAEGDVWTHTKLVLHELAELDEWKSLAPEDREILAFTGLFHDAAKPITTELDKETGHESFRRNPKLLATPIRGIELL